MCVIIGRRPEYDGIMLCLSEADMTERYAHYHKNGTVTARLEIVRSEKEGAVGGFIQSHEDHVRESFDGKISAGADESYECMCTRDRAYRYRPYTMRVEYAAEFVKRKAVLRVYITCTSGRQTIHATEERHRFRMCGDAAIYLGAAK